MGKRTDGAMADISGPQHSQVRVPKHAAGDATEDHAIFRAPFDCKIRKVTVIPGAAITGAATNSMTLHVFNRLIDGTGTTDLGNRAYTAGNNEVAYVGRDLYAPATPLAVPKGTVLSLQRELVGTGLASPDLLAHVEYEAN